MHKLEANELVGTTFYTIHKMKEYKNGGDMLILYFSYIEQSRIQQTNQTRSNDKFMIIKSGLKHTRFKNAKKGLKELGLIDVIQGRRKDGQIDTWYVKVNFLINEQKIKTSNITYEVDQLVDLLPSGETTTNALSIKKKCLKNNNKNIHESKFRALFNNFGLTKEYIEKKFKFKKNLDTIINHCTSIKEICSELDILPIYDRETINAVDIMFKNGHTIESIVKYTRDDWAERIDDFTELIRKDYYLPVEIDK